MTGAEFSAFREQKGVTQTLVSIKTGIPTWRLSRFEDGKAGGNLSREELEKAVGAVAVLSSMTLEEIRQLRAA